MPIARITPLLFMNDCTMNRKMGESIFLVTDTLQGVLEFLNRTFTLCYLGTKQELMKIDSKNIYQRGIT